MARSAAAVARSRTDSVGTIPQNAESDSAWVSPACAGAKAGSSARERANQPVGLAGVARRGARDPVERLGELGAAVAHRQAALQVAVVGLDVRGAGTDQGLSLPRSKRHLEL